jgi:tetratricopeptide (TPR) repeat protein
MSKIKSNKKPGNEVSDLDRNTLKSDFYVSIFLFGLTFILYANTLGHGFVLDDPLAIELNKNVTHGFSGILDIIFGGYRENNFGGQLYRPVSLIQFAIEWGISPNNPFIHHLFNILWYCFTVVIAYRVWRLWFKNEHLWIPLLAAIIFAVHPLHTEVVANIKSRDEIMSLFFLLTSFYFFHSHQIKKTSKYLILALLSFLFALLSKESAITMTPIYGLLAWFVYHKTWKESITKGAIFIIPAIVLLLIRWKLFGGELSPPIDIMDNPIVSATGLDERYAASMTVLGKYLFLLFFPIVLSSDYSFQVIPIANLSNIWVWVSLLIYLGAFIWAIKNLKNRDVLALCILGYLFSISIYSQLFMVIGTMFGERLAYLPSFWFVLGFVLVVFRVFKIENVEPYFEFSRYSKKAKSVLVVFGLISVLGIFKTIDRNADWKDNFTLFTVDSATYPNSIRLHNGAADQYYSSTLEKGFDIGQEQAYLDKSEYHCNEMLKVRHVATAYLTLGNIRTKQKKFEEALVFYDKVNDLKTMVDANKALVYRELGRQAGEKENDLVKANEMLVKSLELNDKDPETWFLNGVLSGMQGDHARAAEKFEKAYQLNPIKEYAKSAMMAFQNMGNTQKSQEYQKLSN